MNQVEQDYISDFLESLHPTDIDNRMCFKASVNSFIEERELLISPESFILYTLFKIDYNIEIFVFHKVCRMMLFHVDFMISQHNNN